MYFLQDQVFLSNCCSNPSIHKWTEFLSVDKPAAVVKYVRAPGAISNKWKQRIYWSISSEHQTLMFIETNEMK